MSQPLRLSTSAVNPRARGQPKKLSQISIRVRLLIAFVLMALLSAICMSIGSIVVGYYSAERQALDRLQSVATRKEAEIQAWLSGLQNELVNGLNEEYAFERASVVLDLAQNDIYYEFYNRALRNRLVRFVGQSRQLEELFLLDLQGRVALATVPSLEGQSYANYPFFQLGIQEPSAQVVELTSSQAALTIYAARPVFNQDGKSLGIIAGRTYSEKLQDILNEQTSLGRTGRTYLVDATHRILAQSDEVANGNQPRINEPGTADSVGISLALDQRRHGAGVYDDHRQVRVVGVYRWLPELQAALLTEQTLTEALEAIYLTLGVNVGIALLAVVLAAGASLFITRSITNPLVNLVDTATQVAAGNLDRTTTVEREDEVGALAHAFNSMTAQLRDLIGSLERRVKDRTHALQEANQTLERRALQLETSAQVSREVTSILHVDELLTRVVDLIRDAFRYYQVQVFLVDQETNQLILRASSGQTSLQHRQLDIGPGSLNGEAAVTNQALLVNDVSLDSRYLLDAQLPATRSELVIPLAVGRQVIGTLDVHSAALNAFSSEDVLVIKTLSDQVAIAIENARLYDRSRTLAVLEERNRLARELHDSVTQLLYSQSLLTVGWQRLVRAGRDVNFEDYLTRMGEISQQALKEMRLLIYELRPPLLEQDGLLGALRQRLEAVERRAGVEAYLIAEDLLDLPVPMEEELYRITQEALNNALKHAAATLVTLRVAAQEDGVTVEVMDNGRGFDPEIARRSGGIGLSSMQERARRIGGEVQVVSRAGGGTTVKVTVRTRSPLPVAEVRL